MTSGHLQSVGMLRHWASRFGWCRGNAFILLQTEVVYSSHPVRQSRTPLSFEASGSTQVVSGVVSITSRRRLEGELDPDICTSFPGWEGMWLNYTSLFLEFLSGWYRLQEFVYVMWYSNLEAMGNLTGAWETWPVPKIAESIARSRFRLQEPRAAVQVSAQPLSQLSVSSRQSIYPSLGTPARRLGALTRRLGIPARWLKSLDIL